MQFSKFHIKYIWKRTNCLMHTLAEIPITMKVSLKIKSLLDTEEAI